MSSTNEKLPLVGYFQFAGPAVERDRELREKNNSEPSDEETWNLAFAENKDRIFAAHAAFFAELGYTK